MIHFQSHFRNTLRTIKFYLPPNIILARKNWEIFLFNLKYKNRGSDLQINCIFIWPRQL